MQAGLYYFGDPMCSWCWGVAPALTQLVEEYKDKLEFKIVLGGLRNGGGDAWDDTMKNFLREHWEHVAKASGQPFNYDLLNWEEFNYDTEPSCRAVVVARDMDAAIALPFFKGVQNAFYALNLDPNKIETYASLCEEHGLDFDEFTERFNSDASKEKVQKEFQTASEMGIRGFPSIAVIGPEGEGFLIANGYATYKELSERVGQALSKFSPAT